MWRKKWNYLGIAAVWAANLSASIASPGDPGVAGDIGDGGEQSLTAESELRRALAALGGNGGGGLLYSRRYSRAS